MVVEAHDHDLGQAGELDEMCSDTRIGVLPAKMQKSIGTWRGHNSYRG